MTFIDDYLSRTPRRRLVRQPHFDQNDWFGRRGLVTLANQSVGSITPAGLVWPNDYDQWDFNSTTDLSGVPDVTANVQAAINTIQQSGQGGIVQLPPGVLRINGVTISGGGVTIKGAGWEENTSGASPAKRGKRGTYILSDNRTVGGTAITVAAAANNVKVLDCAFVQPYLPDQVGWTDVFTQPSILLAGPSSGGLVVEKCMFWGVHVGIGVGTDGATPAGLITIRDCEMAPLLIGVDIRSCTTLVIDNLKVVPDVFLANNTNQLANLASNGSGVSIQNTPTLVITNSQFSGVSAAIFGVNFGKSIIKISDCNVSNCGDGIQDFGQGNIWKLTGWEFAGRGASKIARGIEFGGTSAFYDITDSYFHDLASSAILINAGAGTVDVRFGPNLWVDNWNLNPGLDGSVPNPSPALTVKGTATCRYSSGAARFTNANGGPNTGGGGTFTTY